MGRVINVLLIEDSEDDALFFRMGLRTSSARLVRVADTEAATKHLEMQPLPDLIVMDLRLPGMPVNRFLDWIRSKPEVQKVPIVIYTGAVRVPEDVKAAVLQIFFKSLDLVENRRTVLEIIRLANPAEPKTSI